MERLSLIVIIVIAFLDGFLVANEWKGTGPDSSVSEAIALENILEQKNSSTIANTEDITGFQAVPFTSQAPLGIWESPWVYFAEEAVMLMAEAWAKDTELENPSLSLLKIRDWELATLGTFKDTDLDQNLRVLKEYFSLQAEISYDVSRENLLTTLDQGKIFLIPVNGQLLDNPHYADPGPTHHMLLIYGYSAENFLTHDPGTIRGEGMHYPIEKILKALQDLEGEGRVIEVSR